MADYTLIFGIALILNAIITFRSSAFYKKFFSRANANEEIADPAEVKRHQVLLRKYLAVYLLATLSDWLQGPYVYALYDAYGYSQHAIAVLFVAGFGSSKYVLCYDSSHLFRVWICLC
jgi:hypothetical protein